MESSSIAPWVLLVAALIYGSARSPAETRSALLLDCGTIPLVVEKCDNILKVDQDEEILINTTTQKVQIGGWLLAECNVVDADNWECKEPFVGDAAHRFEMHYGHLTKSLTGGPPPDGYQSSVTGWRRLAVQYHLLTPTQAQSYE
jgi:hypothetical protein